MIIGVTGHRPHLLGGYDNVTFEKLKNLALEALIEEPPSKVITGMALGWDTAIALACVELSIPFVAAVPFLTQPDTWPATSKALYKKLLSNAVHVSIISPRYHTKAMLQRNHFIVDHSDEILALYNGGSGGTGNCVKYAKFKQKPIKNLWGKWTLS